MVVDKVAAMTSGGVEDTGHHLRVSGSQDDLVEVELAFRKRGRGFAALVDTEEVRIFYAESDANVWTVAGEAMVRLAEKRQCLERLRKERADTEKCILLLKGFPFSEQEKFFRSVHDGRAHLDIRAGFSPERFPAFLDMVEMATLVLKDGATSPVDEEMRCNMRDGKSELVIRASFGPERIETFKDMVGMARLTLKDGDTLPPAEEEGTLCHEIAA